MSYDYDRRVFRAAIIWSDKGDRYEVSGTYNELQSKLQKLKSQGWNWDPGRKVWGISKDKLTPKKLENIQKILGIAPREEPSQEFYDKAIDALKPYGKMYPGGLILGPLGVDFREYGAEWSNSSPKGWLLGPRIDSKRLVRDLPKITQAIETLKDKTEALVKLPSDRNLQVALSDGYIYLSGDGTFHIKEDLKPMGFRYENRAWSRGIAGLSKADVAALPALLEGARKQQEGQKREEEEKRREDTRGSPASPQQIALLKRLVVKHRNDWYDVTQGIAGMEPPSMDRIESMTRQEASSYIQMIDGQHD